MKGVILNAASADFADAESKDLYNNIAVSL